MKKLLTTRGGVGILFATSTVGLLVGASFLNHERSHSQYHFAKRAVWLNEWTTSCCKEEQEHSIQQQQHDHQQAYKTYGLIIPQQRVTNHVKITPHKAPHHHHYHGREQQQQQQLSEQQVEEEEQVLFYSCKIQQQTFNGKWKTAFQFVLKKQDLSLQLVDNGAVRHELNKMKNSSVMKKEEYIDTWNDIVIDNVVNSNCGCVVDLRIHKRDPQQKSSSSSGTLIHMNRLTSQFKLSKTIQLPQNKKELIQYLIDDHVINQNGEGIKILKMVKKADEIKQGKEIRIHEAVIRSGEAVTVYGKLSSGNKVLDVHLLSEEDDDHFIKHLARRDYSHRVGKSSYVSAVLYQIYELVDDAINKFNK